MEPRIIIKSSFTVVGLSLPFECLDGNSEALWAQLSGRFQEIPDADPGTGFGVHTWNGSERHYLAGMALRGAIKGEKVPEVPKGMEAYHLKKHAYAVFPHHGLIDYLSTTIDTIFNDWLPGSGYQTAENYYFELYDDRFQPGSEDSVLFIFVPVKQR